MDVRTFRRKIEKAIRDQAPDATIEYLHGPTWCKWADGSKGRTAVVAVAAPGFRPKQMHAYTGAGMEFAIR